MRTWITVESGKHSGSLLQIIMALPPIWARCKIRTTSMHEPEFYTLPAPFVREHHYHSGGWEKVSLLGLDGEIESYKDGAVFKLIARALGVPRPSRRGDLPRGRRARMRESNREHPTNPGRVPNRLHCDDSRVTGGVRR